MRRGASEPSAAAGGPTLTRPPLCCAPRRAAVASQRASVASSLPACPSSLFAVRRDGSWLARCGCAAVLRGHVSAVAAVGGRSAHRARVVPAHRNGAHGQRAQQRSTRTRDHAHVRKRNRTAGVRARVRHTDTHSKAPCSVAQPANTVSASHSPHAVTPLCAAHLLC